MKKNVLCLFSLILYGLLACTILSTRIQEEMTTLVRVEDRIASKRDPKTISLLACTILSTRIQEEMTTLVRVEDRIASKRDPKTISLNSRSLFEKNRYPIADDGYYLFEIADRGGWSPGIRTHPVPEYTFQGETAVVYVHIDRNYTFVRAASRNPLPGKLAQPVKYFQRGADTNLLIYGRAFPKTREMPPGYTLAGEGDHALLLKTSQGSFPFLPHYLRTANMTTDFAQWVFSLTEAKAFLSVVPNAAVISMTLLGIVLLWVFSCVLAVHADNHKWLLALNGLLALASLALIWYIPLDFPASMLPPASILDWDYYRSEFSVLLTGLANFPEELAPMQAAITQMQERWVFSLTEAKAFLSVVPNAAVISMTLLGIVLLWVFSCVLAVHADNHKWLLALNGLLALASLALIWYIPLDFPASMLPPASILDWDYYRSEFSVLLTGLANFPEELAPMQAAITQMQERCRTVFRIGLAVPALLILAEAVLPTLAARKASNPQPQLPEA